MATVSELQTRLDALRAARDNGVLTVREGEKTVTYRSLAEIEQIIGTLQADVDRLNNKTRHRVARAYVKSKGY